MANNIEFSFGFSNDTQKQSDYVRDLVSYRLAAANSKLVDGNEQATPIDSKREMDLFFSSTNQSDGIMSVTEFTHYVQKSDSFASICLKYGIDKSELLRANHLSGVSNIFTVGKLQIPEKRQKTKRF